MWKQAAFTPTGMDVSNYDINPLSFSAQFALSPNMDKCYSCPYIAGLAVGVQLAGLQWRIRGVMLAGPTSYYQEQQAALAHSFAAKYLPGMSSV